MGSDGQELAARWSIVAELRTPGFSENGGSHKANRKGSGDVQGLCSYAQALIPVLDKAPSGFTSHVCMRDALQAVRTTHESLWADFRRAATQPSEWWRLMCKHVYNVAKTRAAIEDAVVMSMVAQIKLPVNAGGDVCARVAGGELEAASKNSDSADFAHRSSSHVRRFRRRPADRVSGTHYEYEMLVRTAQDASLSAAPSSSEFCSSKLLLASLEPPPLSRASETCCDTWETAVASLEPPPRPSVSKSCSDQWKTAIASLKPPPIPSASRSGQGQCQSQKKRRVIGTVLRKPAAQSQTTPEEPSLGELEALSRSYDVGNLRAVLRRHTHLHRKLKQLFFLFGGG